MSSLKEIKEMFTENSIQEGKEPIITVNGNVSAIGNGNIIVHTSKVTEKKEYIIKPNEEHISEEQAAKLKELVHKIYDMEQNTKKKPKTMQSIWYSLNKHCQVTTYRAIKYEDYEKAVKFLRSWGGKLNSTPTARKKNPKWRNNRYAAIHAICNQHDLDGKRLAYMEKKFGTIHMSHLNDDDLDTVYRYISGVK